MYTGARPDNAVSLCCFVVLDGVYGVWRRQRPTTISTMHESIIRWPSAKFTVAFYKKIICLWSSYMRTLSVCVCVCCRLSVPVNECSSSIRSRRRARYEWRPKNGERHCIYAYGDYKCVRCSAAEATIVDKMPTISAQELLCATTNG